MVCIPIVPIPTIPRMPVPEEMGEKGVLRVLDKVIAVNASTPRPDDPQTARVILEDVIAKLIPLPNYQGHCNGVIVELIPVDLRV